MVNLLKSPDSLLDITHRIKIMLNDIAITKQPKTHSFYVSVQVEL